MVWISSLRQWKETLVNSLVHKKAPKTKRDHYNSCKLSKHIQRQHSRMYSTPSILQPSILRPPCNIRPHFLGPMGGLKIEEPLYLTFTCLDLIATQPGTLCLGKKIFQSPILANCHTRKPGILTTQPTGLKTSSEWAQVWEMAPR